MVVGGGGNRVVEQQPQQQHQAGSNTYKTPLMAIINPDK